MEKSEHIDKLAAAIIAVQAELPHVPKDGANPYYKARYATLHSIVDSCRGALQKHGLSVVQLPVGAEPGRISLTTIVLHSSGQYIGATATYDLAKTDPQGGGSAITYARRYGISAALGIVTEDDDDGNAASQTDDMKASNNEEVF